MDADAIAQKPPEVDSSDPASKEFRKLKREVGLLRIAVEKLADEPASIVIPDYTETLEGISEQMQATAEQLAKWSEKPALRLTPQALSDAIVKAGSDARADDHTALAKATSTMRETERQIASVIASARTAEQQRTWLWRAGLIGAVVGAFVAIVLPVFAINVAPTSWHWPEKRATSILGGDMWFAGERLQARADQDRWVMRSDLERMTEGSRERLAACMTAAAKAQRPTRCEVTLKAPKPEAQ
jgi:hypothetical protein